MAIPRTREWKGTDAKTVATRKTSGGFTAVKRRGGSGSTTGRKTSKMVTRR